MAKRGRPRKNPLPEPTPDTSPTTPTEPDEVSIEGIAPNRYDVEDELELMEPDPYHKESAMFGRNPDDPDGGVGLNFGDW